MNFEAKCNEKFYIPRIPRKSTTFPSQSFSKDKETRRYDKVSASHFARNYFQHPKHPKKYIYIYNTSAMPRFIIQITFPYNVLHTVFI